MTYDIWVFCLLLLWTNHLHYLNYWVSLGRFYLLDIHCDYSYISPLCGVAQTPDCGMLVIYLSFISPLCGIAQTPDCGMFVIYLLFISPLCGVAQTPDWGMIYLIILFKASLQTLDQCILFSTSVLHIHILPAYEHHGFSFISWQTL